MKIIDIEVHGIAGLADGLYSFGTGEGASAEVTLITGDAGTGKTRLLESVIAAKEAVGSWGSTGRLRQLKRTNVERAAIVARWKLSPAESDEGRLATAEFTTRCVIDDRGGAALDCPLGLKRVFQAHDEAGLARFGYLHADRQWPSYSAPDAQPFTALLADNRKFGHVLPRALDLLAEDQANAARASAEGGLVLPGARSHLTDLREALRPFLPRHALVSFAHRDGEGELVFQTKAGELVDASALSASERQGLLVALEAIMNHRSSGLVLWDEPELHRHPAEQVAFFKAYGALVPGAQIIAATSSPALLRAAAEWAHVIQLPIGGKP